MAKHANRPAAQQPPSDSSAQSGQRPRSEATIIAVAPETDTSHRREHSRFSVDLDVNVGSDHNFYAGFAENLSAGGVFVATHQLKPVGSIIDITINLPGGGQVRASGEVRWVRVFNEHSDTPPGMGVKFRNLAESSTEAIEGFLAQREPLFFDDDE